MSLTGHFVCNFPSQPSSVYCCWEEFADGGPGTACPNTNFLKGVKWSPDGSCCLVVGDDNWLRLFDLPQDALTHQPAAEGNAAANAAGCAVAAKAAADGMPLGTAAAENQSNITAASYVAVGSQWRSGLQVHAGETVYDYCWFSGMSATDPVSCCFASTSRGQPIKLWDACTGGLRASYRGYDDADEVTAAISVAFSPDGSKLVAGYNRAMRVFDVSRPGRDYRRINTYKKRQEGSIPGIISCLAFSPVHHDLLAAGSYSCCTGIFDARTYEPLLLLEGHTGGVTQVLFSPDGNFLYTGARRDDQLHCWDIRATGQVLYSMKRATVDTNQRIAFSIEPSGRHLATGGCDGNVAVYDLVDGHQVDCFRAAADTINGVDFSPCLNLLVTASGHRRYSLMPTGQWAEDESLSLMASSTAGIREAGSNGCKLSRALAEGQEGNVLQQLPHIEQQHVQDDCKTNDSVFKSERNHTHGSDELSGLAPSSWWPGGMCNSLRLWRLEAQWVAAAEAADKAAVVAAAGQEELAGRDACGAT